MPNRSRTGTAEQLGTFLITAGSHRLYAFYRLAVYTGARRGELLYLRWQAVNLDAAEVTFGGSTAVVHGQRIEGTTKGGTPPPCCWPVSRYMSSLPGSATPTRL